MPFCLVDRELAPVVHAAADLVAHSAARCRSRTHPRAGCCGTPRASLPVTHVVGLHVGGRRVVLRALRRQRDDDRCSRRCGPGCSSAAGWPPDDRARSRRSTRPLLPNDVIVSPFCALIAVRCAGVEIEDPAILAIGALPVVESSCADRALVRVPPDLLAGRRVERDDGVAGRPGTYITPSITIGLKMMLPVDRVASRRPRAARRSTC